MVNPYWEEHEKPSGVHREDDEKMGWASDFADWARKKIYGPNFPQTPQEEIPEFTKPEREAGRYVRKRRKRMKEIFEDTK